MNALYEGWVGHRRVQPVDHRFRYRVFMAYLDLDTIPERVGPAWLWSTTHPAPVSFYYCFDHAGEELQAVVAEVTNTPWGERHAYVLAVRSEDGGVRERVDKVFHVSPFMAMDHEYELCLTPPGRHLGVEIVSRRDGEVHFDATLQLDRAPLDAPGLRRVLRRQPAPTLAVVTRIYANAVRLKLKGAPYFGHPREAPR